MAQEFYGSIRVKDDKKRISINDDGDYIEISPNDTAMFDRFFDLVQWFGEMEKDAEQKEKELRKKYGTDEENLDRAREEITFLREGFKESARRIDAIFGEDTCAKAFCGMEPNLYLISQFFEQLTPIIRAISNDRSQEFAAKYGPARKGGKKAIKRK